MMEVGYYAVTQEQMSEYATAAMYAVVDQMIQEGYLTDTLGTTFMDTHAVAFVNDQSFLNKWAARLGLLDPKKDNKGFYRCLKLDKYDYETTATNTSNT